VTVSPAPTGVAGLLLEYGRELAERGDAQVGDSFTGDSERDALISSEPFAFLVGVLFTQGIPAERAWSAPFELRRRLGHLEPARICAEPERVRSAIQRRPMLHRFKNTMPDWVVAAGCMVEQEYAGRAERIWPSGAHTVDVTERLLRFPGIGAKKSVMAVEILTRHLGVELVGRECGQVAYDVQVRRVFLRSGLVAKDSIAEVEAAAAEICPGSPGTLDLATWLIGRTSCRPRTPLCETCRLGHVCPRQVWLDVEGVGVRARRA
jgi:uncharacterized HhH-GPD family protein